MAQHIAPRHLDTMHRCLQLSFKFIQRMVVYLVFAVMPLYGITVNFLSGSGNLYFIPYVVTRNGCALFLCVSVWKALTAVYPIPSFCYFVCVICTPFCQHFFTLLWRNSCDTSKLFILVLCRTIS